ncbi:tetratricopeptide repeat protein [Streptomyces sp. NPDC057889]|uniref:tetratricopeptide repeat protein n=1 Tax=unclassified Streptomyces TaxID=2593676 RepID=UPI0036A3E7ED
MRALAERLRAVMDAAGLGTVSELAEQAGVGETVASEALRAVRAPTEQTLRRLLGAFGVPFDDQWRGLLRAASAAGLRQRGDQRELERAAAARAAPVVVRSRSAPEMEQRRRLLAGYVHVGADGDLPLVSQVRDRALLGIHPAAPPRLSRPGVVLDAELPSYVLRDADGELRGHVRQGRDHGGLVLVHGPSTAGKTRAAAEAIWAELAGWALLVPVVPESLVHLAGARLDLTRTVIWLNELDVYLGAGGRQAEALTRLLALPERPLVVATVRAHQLSDLEEDEGHLGSDDGRRPAQDRRTTALVAGLLGRACRVRMERMFSAGELARAEELREDTRLADALKSAGRYGVAEALAAGPELLRLLWAHTDAPDGYFGGAALVHASVDAARVGWRRPLSPAALRELLAHYVPSDLRQEVDEALFERSLRWARRRRRGFSRLLVDDESGNGVVAFDYLVDQAQTRLPQASVPEVLWSVLLGAATPEEALELGHHAQRWGQVDVAVAAWRRAAASPVAKVATEAAEVLGRLLMERANPEGAMPYLLQAAQDGDWWAGALAIEWYAARRQYEEALVVVGWRAARQGSVRGTRRSLCNVLVGLARWEELGEVVRQFREADEGVAPEHLLGCVRLLAERDPAGQCRATDDELNELFVGHVHRRWWELRVEELAGRLDDPSPGCSAAALPVLGESADREPVPAIEYAGRQERSEAELLAATVGNGAWDRSEAWHALIARMWSQDRLGQAEELLREAAASDDVAARVLVQLLRLTGRRTESLAWRRERDGDDDAYLHLTLLVTQRELGEATRLASESDLREDLVELCAVHGLAEQAVGLADDWAREGDPSPAMELYRRAQEWERLLAVVPPHAPDDQRFVVSSTGVDYVVHALIEQERFADAESTARRLFEAGEGSHAFVLADLMVRQGQPAEAEELLGRMWRDGSPHHALRARDELGRLLIHRGRYEEAIRVLRDQSLAVRDNVSPPRDPVDRIALARALAGTGAVDTAVGELRQHLEQFEPYSTREVWLTLAELLVTRGRAAEAAAMLGQAAGSDAGARYALARHFVRNGQADQAIDLLSRSPDGGRQFAEDMMCAVLLSTLLRDEGRTDAYQLVLWRAAHLNWLEAAMGLARGAEWQELDDVVWAVDASGLVLPDNFRYLRRRAARNDLTLTQPST